MMMYNQVSIDFVQGLIDSLERDASSNTIMQARRKLTEMKGIEHYNECSIALFKALRKVDSGKQYRRR